MQKLNYVNLGCGQWLHPQWINIDFVSTGPGVIAHNLLQGIPLNSESMEVVYHSHVLEHFSKEQAEIFIQECYRILKKGGIIRIAVPDLERIIREYVQIIDTWAQNTLDREIKARYDWIMLELYDQTIRNTSGGEMAKYLFQDIVPNIDYIYSRIGYEGKNLREHYMYRKQIEQQIPNVKSLGSSILRRFISAGRHPERFFKQRLKMWLFKEDVEYERIGRFRAGGEIHQWMYDQYSLARLLEKYGFSDIKKQSETESAIPSWSSFGLDTVEGKIRKPDSLFMEAIK